MTDLSRKGNIMVAEMLCIPVAAISYICAIMFSLRSGYSPLSLAMGSAALIAIHFLLRIHIRKSESLNGNLILISLLLLFASARPGLLPFNGGQISTVLMTVALYLSSVDAKKGCNDIEARAAAMITAASFATPPIIWMLPLFLIHSARKAGDLRSVVAVISGTLITYIAALCILFLCFGIDGVQTCSVRYFSDLTDISVTSISFNGWKTLQNAVFLLAIIATIIRYTMYRTRANSAEASISGTAGIIICTSLMLAVLFGGDFFNHLILLASLMSAFLLSMLATTDGEKNFAKVLMIAIALSAVVSIASEFFPAMNEILWK